jgi:hypothetical protein
VVCHRLVNSRLLLSIIYCSLIIGDVVPSYILLLLRTVVVGMRDVET